MGLVPIPKESAEWPKKLRRTSKRPRGHPKPHIFKQQFFFYFFIKRVFGSIWCVGQEGSRLQFFLQSFGKVVNFWRKRPAEVQFSRPLTLYNAIRKSNPKQNIIFRSWDFPSCVVVIFSSGQNFLRKGDDFL